jgi:hypothetical protein
LVHARDYQPSSLRRRWLAGDCSLRASSGLGPADQQWAGRCPHGIEQFLMPLISLAPLLYFEQRGTTAPGFGPAPITEALSWALTRLWCW